MIDEAERAKFVAWTFERQLALLEDYDAGFDREAPTADLTIAGLVITQMPSLEDDEDDEDSASAAHDPRSGLGATGPSQTTDQEGGCEGADFDI